MISRPILLLSDSFLSPSLPSLKVYCVSCCALNLHWTQIAFIEYVFYTKLVRIWRRIVWIDMNLFNPPKYTLTLKLPMSLVFIVLCIYVSQFCPLPWWSPFSPLWCLLFPPLWHMRAELLCPFYCCIRILFYYFL